MKLTPTLTPPSPVVNARSANDGPNVVAVRTCSPVLGSSLMVNPLEEAASGIVPTSRMVSKFRASPVCGAATGLTIPDTVPAIVSSPVVVVVP